MKNTSGEILIAVWKTKKKEEEEKSLHRARIKPTTSRRPALCYERCLLNKRLIHSMIFCPKPIKAALLVSLHHPHS